MKPWIGCEIKLLRSQLGWNRAQLARFMGCSPLKIVKMEYDEVIPTPNEKMKLQTLAAQTEQIEEQRESGPLNQFNVDIEGPID